MEWLLLLLKLLGGLALFLFGLRIMGEALEARAGERLRDILGRLTTGRVRGLAFGTLLTATVQSSSAVSVMTVGFVDAGMLGLSQAIGIIMGANVGTTVTAWLLSTSSFEGAALFSLLKPSFWAPILGIAGTVLLLSSKKEKSRLTAKGLLGFFVLMTGMEQMSDAVRPFADMPEVEQALLVVSHPLVGVLVGALVTAVLQSSSASVGILQALSSAGRMPIGTAIPIIMGQNIGTCVTTLIASVGAGKNAKRVAISHLYFNLVGTLVFLTLFVIVQGVFSPPALLDAASPVTVAATHTAFNVFTTILLFPFVGLLEKLARRSVPDRAGIAKKS